MVSTVTFGARFHANAKRKPLYVHLALDTLLSLSIIRPPHVQLCRFAGGRGKDGQRLLGGTVVSPGKWRRFVWSFGALGVAAFCCALVAAADILRFTYNVPGD